jgi:hypothetical protein
MVSQEACDARLNFVSPVRTRTKVSRLRIMATSSDPKIRAAAASNPHAPIDVLKLLGADISKEVRSWVARNYKTPEWLVSELAKDEDKGIQAFAKYRLTALR